MSTPSALRQIPSVERILSSDELAPLISAFGRDAVRDEVRRYLDSLRRRKGAIDVSFGTIADAIRPVLASAYAPSLRHVVNGTGVLIHTNLGRSPVDREMWADAGEFTTQYSNLEFNLQSGSRGSREQHLGELATRIFGCEDAVLVNNNAAGVLLVLAAISAGREVIVSRGELVEIGGGFRVPEVIEQGGAKLREVGTTNKTRAADFSRAASPDTGAILSVHQSNFQIVGFTEAPTVEDLVSVSRNAGVPLVVDEGSGRVVDLSKYGFRRQQTIRELFEAGVDAVTCSTDKLLGSLQGGLILGKSEIIRKCSRHPLMRAFRVGKETYAMHAGTLAAFAAGQHETKIPIYRMLATPIEMLRDRASTFASEKAEVVDTESVLGGGTTPTETIPSVGIHLFGKASELQEKFLRNDPPILGRIEDDRFILDLRTVQPDEDPDVAAAIG